jgi:hypothetical protein
MAGEPGAPGALSDGVGGQGPGSRNLHRTSTATPSSWHTARLESGYQGCVALCPEGDLTLVQGDNTTSVPTADR